MGCLPYSSRLKWCLHGANPTNPCPVRSLQDVSLTHPGWNGAYRNSHKPVPSMLYTGRFTYTSRLKWFLREHLQETSSQYAIYSTFHLHIQAEKVSMDNSHKPMPTTISTRCFSYTSRLKWCLRGTSSHKPLHSMLCTGCFSYTSRLKWCIHRTTPTNPCSLQYLPDVSLHT